MSSVILRIAAPLQSWGVSSLFDQRDSFDFPTRSALTGLIANAMGMKRKDDLSMFDGIRTAVRADSPGVKMTDDVSVQAPLNQKSSGRYLLKKTYLQDAVFLAVIEHEDSAFVMKIADALKNPARPLYFGRKCCIPTFPLVLDVLDCRADQAVELVPDLCPQKKERKVRVLQDSFCEEGLPVKLRDLPVQFDLNHSIWKERTAYMREIPVPDGFLQKQLSALSLLPANERFDYGNLSDLQQI